jgi:hypothetical protein
VPEPQTLKTGIVFGEALAKCTELRALQVVLALLAFRDDFGDMEGWDASIRGMLDTLVDASPYG